MSDDRIYTQADLEAAVSVVRAERDEVIAWPRRGVGDRGHPRRRGERGE